MTSVASDNRKADATLFIFLDRISTVSRLAFLHFSSLHVHSLSVFGRPNKYEEPSDRVRSQEEDQA